MVLKATVQKKSPKQLLPKVTSEAAVCRCSSKYVFLEISQYRQKTSVLESLFSKVAGLTALKPATLFKRDFNTGVFL